MYKDYLLLGIVTLMSVAANLPDRILGLSLLDRKLLVIGLLLVVSIALVRYSKLALVLAVVILAIGANLPEELAITLNVEPRILVFTLIAIVLFSFANRLMHLPSGLEKRQGFGGTGNRALFSAVARGQSEIVAVLLENGADLTMIDPQGRNALQLARAANSKSCAALLLAAGKAELGHSQEPLAAV